MSRSLWIFLDLFISFGTSYFGYLLDVTCKSYQVPPVFTAFKPSRFCHSFGCPMTCQIAPRSNSPSMGTGRTTRVDSPRASESSGWADPPVLKRGKGKSSNLWRFRLLGKIIKLHGCYWLIFQQAMFDYVLLLLLLLHIITIIIITTIYYYYYYSYYYYYIYIYPTL